MTWISMTVVGIFLSQSAGEQVFKTVVAQAGPQNARNSEAAIIPLKDGSLLLGWTEFTTSDGSDHAPARISGVVSKDQGRTWGQKYTLVENDAPCNVMEVNFLRLRNEELALFTCQCMDKTGETDCRIMMRTSRDEGKTWQGARALTPEGTYAALTNGRCIRLKSGRILLEAYEKGEKDLYSCTCLISDDDGATWRKSGQVRPESGSAYEPACIELKDGRVMMLLRTGLGGQFKSLSTDGGETWTPPEPTPLKDAGAPVAISRMPRTGDLLAIWNNNPGAKKRNPLTSAISSDEGETWTHWRNVEESPEDAWAYPAITWVGENALVTYFNYSGGLSLQLKILPETWFKG